METCWRSADSQTEQKNRRRTRDNTDGCRRSRCAVLSSHMGEAGRWFQHLRPLRSFLAQPIHSMHHYAFFRCVPNITSILYVTTHAHPHTSNKPYVCIAAHACGPTADLLPPGPPPHRACSPVCVSGVSVRTA